MRAALCVTLPLTAVAVTEDKCNSDSKLSEHEGGTRVRERERVSQRQGRGKFRRKKCIKEACRVGVWTH